MFSHKYVVEPEMSSQPCDRKQIHYNKIVDMVAEHSQYGQDCIMVL